MEHLQKLRAALAQKDVITIGKALRPAMAITDQEEASLYLAELVAFYLPTFGGDAERAREVALAHLGYFAGYYDAETRARVERLFNCSHPIFGKIKNGAPTSEEASAAGVASAQRNA